MGGLFVPENLCVAHKSCDTAFDSAEMLYSPDKRIFYCDPRFAAYTPDVSQLKHISTENLTARWLWAKRVLGAVDTSDSFFVDYINMLGYVAKAF